MSQSKRKQPSQFAKELLKWRGNRFQKEAASLLDVSLDSYRHWEQGFSTPHERVQELIRQRMEAIK